MTLVEFQADGAGDMGLAGVDGGLQHGAFRAEPETVVDQFGITRHQLVLEVHRAAVQRDGFDTAVRLKQQGAAGCFIDAA